MTLRLAVSVAGSSVFELLLRMREAFVEVVEDLWLVRERAQLGRVVTAAEVGGLRAERVRDERVAFHGRQHQDLRDRAHAFNRAPCVLVLQERLGEGNEPGSQRVEVGEERRFLCGG